MLPQTIDEVIESLSQRVEHFRVDGNRNGYFATLYRNTTIRIRDGIRAGRFEESERMERLDVHFANRYLFALDEYLQGRSAPNAWTVAFTAANRWSPLILQHMLLGMNAHICFDLGVSAAVTCPGEAIRSLERDYNIVNDILKEELDEVQQKLANVSPWLGVLDRVGGRTDEMLCGFGIVSARKLAWEWAQKLAQLSSTEIDREVKAMDVKIAMLARGIRNPGIFIRTAMLPIRLGETRKSVSQVIEALS